MIKEDQILRWRDSIYDILIEMEEAEGPTEPEVYPNSFTMLTFLAYQALATDNRLENFDYDS